MATGEAKRSETEYAFENLATAWLELKKDAVTPTCTEGIWRFLTLHVFSEIETTPFSKNLERLRPIETKGSLRTVS